MPSLFHHHVSSHLSWELPNLERGLYPQQGRPRTTAHENRGGDRPSASSSTGQPGEVTCLTQMPWPPSSWGHCEVDQRPPTSGDRWVLSTLSKTSRTPSAHMQGGVSGAGSLVPSKTQGSKGASPPPAAHKVPPSHTPAFHVHAQWALRGASGLNKMLLETPAPNTTSPRHWGPCVCPLIQHEHLVPFTCSCSQGGTTAHTGEATALKRHLLVANPGSSISQAQQGRRPLASASSSGKERHAQPPPSRATSTAVCMQGGQHAAWCSGSTTRVMMAELCPRNVKRAAAWGWGSHGRREPKRHRRTPEDRGHSPP